MTSDVETWLSSLEDGLGAAEDASDLREIGVALLDIEGAESSLISEMARAERTS